MLIVDPLFDGAGLVAVLGKPGADVDVDRIDGAGTGGCGWRGAPDPAMSAGQDGGQGDQVRVGADVRVGVGAGRRQRKRAGAACPAAVNPRGIPDREARSVAVTPIQSGMALRCGDHRGGAAQIALIVEGGGACTDPSAVAAADGRVVGQPAVDRLIDTAACHAQAACGPGVAALAGGVAVGGGHAHIRFPFLAWSERRSAA